MYNDYYLNLINENLEEVIDNQESILNNEATIIENQNTMISGDLYIEKQITQQHYYTMTLTLIVMLILLYKFIERCMR